MATASEPVGERSCTLKGEHELKRKILSDIADHIVLYGPKNWSVLREKPEYAHVIGKAAGPSGKRKFFRWVASVCQPIDDDKTRPHVAREFNEASVAEAIRQTEILRSKGASAAVSQAYLRRAGGLAIDQIDYIRELPRLWDDVYRMRQKAMTEDGLEIRNAKLFDLSIRRRLALLKTSMEVRWQIMDVQYQTSFYNLIVEMIVEKLEHHPEPQREIILALEKLNRQHGMARPPGA